MNVNRNGTSQNDRFLEALDQNYAQADEKNTAELLFFASQLAKRIHFYTLKNEIDGSWEQFFLSDQTVVLSQILLFDISKPENQFRELILEANQTQNLSRKIEILVLGFDALFGLAQNMDYWYKNLTFIHTKNQTEGIAQELESIISLQLSKNFVYLLAAQKFAKEQLEIDIKIEYTFQKIWQSATNTDELLFVGNHKKEQIENGIDELSSIFHDFYEAMLYLKQKAANYLEKSLKESNHAPQMAMFLAFLELFKTSQQHLNSFGRRHLDFYYKEVLKAQTKSFLADSVYLCFSPQNDVDSVFIPKNTPFLYKEDEKARQILYYSQDDLTVNSGKIHKIFTNFIEERFLDLRKRQRRIVTNIYSKNIDDSHFNQKKPFNELKTWASFGESQRGMGINDRTMENARLGFAVAAPVLFLSEGEREINLVLQLLPASFQKFIEILQDISESTGDSTEEVFIKTFIDAFQIYVSVPTGWFAIERYAVNKDHASSSLSIRFGLSSSEKPLSNYQEAVHKEGFSTKFPVIKIVLNDNSYVYPYSLLEILQLKQVRIDVKVKEVRNLALYNTMGILNADAPFYPFTPVPTFGSYLLIGSGEVFNKALQNLQINIEWFDLPRDKAGFFGHYLGYKNDIDNSVFELRLSRLSGGKWIPESEYEQQIFKLFRTQDQEDQHEPRPRGALSKKTTLKNINLAQIQIPPDYLALNHQIHYTNTSQRGFIKLELCNPENSFYHEIYPFLLSDITLENTLAKNRLWGRKEEIPLPKAPYSPQIKKISLDYESSYTITLQDFGTKIPDELQAHIYHLYPFGFHKIHPIREIQYFSLVPKFEYQGSLTIGIEKIQKGEILSLLFYLIDEFTTSSEEQPPQIVWSYLSNNQWKNFQKSAILSDNTNNFLNSGIVKLEIPDDINLDNTIFPKDIVWIKAAAVKHIDEASSTLLVAAQVVVATWQDNKNTYSHLEKPLPASSIQKPLRPILGLQNVKQPLDSFGGKTKEAQEQFYARIGERLRHKKRAITTWDYERLVLEYFPYIHQVKCLPKLSSQSSQTKVGNIMIVVIADPKSSLNPYEPMASNEQLYAIKSFLEEHSSPFVNIEVRNPSYERIKIHCDVKFGAGKNNGLYIRQLENEVKDYLCAWLPPYHKGSQLGGGVHKSDIINFLRSRPYVEFITRFSLTQTAQDLSGKYVFIDTASETSPTETLYATKAWAVLVPASQSHFGLLYSPKEINAQQSGTGFLQISSDFIIS